MDDTQVKNFGENVIFQPRHRYTPSTEQEVLAILERHAGEQIRVRGSLHSWSPTVATDGVLIDIRAFDRVEIHSTAGEPWAEVGAGCVLERLVDELERHGLTLPTVGAVTKQTIAGAIATGTHGSGDSSLSHYVEAVRVAAYDPEDGSARIYEFNEGDPLRAARCSVGAMGVVLSVHLRLRSQYWVTETISHDATLGGVLARREEWPLQQFMLMPYAWRFVSFDRREATKRPGMRERLLSRVYRAYDQLSLELLSHQLLARVLLKFSRHGEPSGMLRTFYKFVAPRLIAGPKTTAPAVTALTLHSRRHASTQHVEMELFVPEDRLSRAVELLTALTEWCAASDKPFPQQCWADLQRVGLTAELTTLRGAYMHHYAFIFRRVLRDDTLISMTSDQERYAIGVFTYLPEEERASYYRFCGFLARAFVRLLEARLHWGKYFPLTFEDIRDLYPALETFRAHCASVDGNGTFRNEYSRNVLGLAKGPSYEGPLPARAIRGS
jgi:hypothetical protein